MPFNEFIGVNPVTMNMSGLDFIAIKTGDIDSTANPAMKQLPGTKPDFRNFEFTVEDELVAQSGSDCHPS
ncbi:MAG: hypothetical protein R2784_10555 [Saprospiraceae bacterium]